MSLIRSFTGEVAQGVTAFGSPVFYVPLLWILWAADRPLAYGLAAVIICCELIGAGIKYFFPVERPKPRLRVTFIQKLDAGSFPSVHSARIAAVASAIIIRGYDPNMQLLAVIMMLAVGWSRVQLKHHRIIDVLAGYMLGGGMACLLLLR